MSEPTPVKERTMRKCFVCMPLIEQTQCIYDAIAEEINATLGCQWQCEKADDARLPGMIEEKIVHSLLNADLVIAVIADPREGNSINPNVMYELGVAHSFRKPALVVADINSKLPFDIHSVEAIQLDFSHPEFILKLRKALQCSLQHPGTHDDLEKRSVPRNPITTQLSNTRIFIEDLPWLWGYCDVLRREREAETVWEIARDLFWAGEALFFESIRESIRRRRKHYFMVEDEPSVLRRVEAIKRELLQEFPKNELDRLIHFVAIEAKYFVLWPIAIVLYDADRVRRQGGIICEPMEALVGGDSFDKKIRDIFANSRDFDEFEKHLQALGWTERREEATFDIALDGRVVDALATSFAEIWNKKILEESQQKTGDEKSALLNTWVIGG
jgi:hypothetical protein